MLVVPVQRGVVIPSALMSYPFKISAAPIALAFFVACGGTTGTGGASNAAGTGGSGTTSVSAGTGGSTTSSTSASATASSGSGGGAACQHAQSQLHLQGTVDAQDLLIDQPSATQSSMASKAELTFGSGGILYLRGGIGVLRMPDGGPLAGKVFYAGTATLANRTFALSALVALGVCPAATGQGTLSFCFNVDNNCPQGALTTTTGALDGAALDWSATANYQGSGVSPTNLSVDWTSGAWLLAMHDGSQSSGHVTAGLLATPAAGPDAGAFWCADGGFFTDSLGATQLDVGEMTRLGTVAEGTAVSGSVEGCF